MIDIDTLTRPLRQSPFALLRGAVLLAAVYACAAMVWLTFGDALPGGRWFAVHLFTLGVLSNLVIALSRHFAHTLLRVDGRNDQRARLVVFNAGALLILGFPPTMRWPLAVGASLAAIAVAWLLVELRGMRADRPDARFAFVVRAYEHAAAAFLLGALLGALLGVGLLPGTWHGSARFAHLHANVLGWGGLTLLATVVFFGPAMMRVRMEPGADTAAARALPYGALGLLLGSAALLLTGAGGGVATAARLAAATGFAGYALAATVVCLHVVRAGTRAKSSAPAWMIRAACAWFIAVVWADVAVVASGRLRLLDALGAALIVAILGQAILAAVEYLTPMVWGRAPEHRNAVRERLGALARVRALALNAGAAVVVAAGIAGPGAAWGTGAVRVGWGLVGLAVVAHLTVIVRGVLGPGGTRRPTMPRDPDRSSG